MGFIFEKGDFIFEKGMRFEPNLRSKVRGRSGKMDLRDSRERISREVYLMVVVIAVWCCVF